MKSKHTPGPWEIEDDNYGNGSYSEWFNIFTKTKTIAQVGRCRKMTGEDIANAQLIATAPKLLHNLKIITEQLRQIDAVTDDENPAMSQDMLDAFHGIEFHISEAGQIINKAEGEK